MKHLFFILLAIGSLSCKPVSQDNSSPMTEISEPDMNSDNFDWLLGSWKRLNEVEGKETYERWEKISEKSYSGLGYTMQKGDMVNQETMELVKTEDGWNLIVKVPDEEEAVTFPMTSSTENEFVCENSVIDFPNKIKYWKNGDKLSASVSNAEMEIPFDFKRHDPK